MSKRCELQKEYYQQYGNYKGNGKYSDKYVSWLEEQILALRIHDEVCMGTYGLVELELLEIEKEMEALRQLAVSNRREQLIAFANYCEREWNCTEIPTDVIDEYLESN